MKIRRRVECVSCKKKMYISAEQQRLCIKCAAQQRDKQPFGLRIFGMR